MFKKKDDIKTFVVIIGVCIICVVLALVLSVKSNFESLDVVNEYNVFFSNVGYLNKYISSIAIKDNDVVYSLLDSKYIENNNITRDNILDKVDKFSILSSYEVESMYFIQIKRNFLYYVNGKVYENTYDAEKKLVYDNYSMVISVDIDNLSYSLYPVDKDYKDVINDVKKIDIYNNGHNSIDKSELISKEHVCVIYLSDFLDKLYSDIDGSYEILSNDMKKTYPSVNDYSKYIAHNWSNISYDASMCRLDIQDDKRVYTVIDSNENVYKFNEESIMNYTASFYFKESK